MMELPMMGCAALASNTMNRGTISGNHYGGTQPAIYTTTNIPAWDLSGITAQFQQPQPESTMQNRRIVQVFIADPNENVPLDKALLYQDEKPHLTDLTDQELFFELDIKDILAKHNEFRVTVVDKEASEGKNKDVLLEPAKIRDLRMTVVSVATF